MEEDKKESKPLEVDRLMHEPARTRIMAILYVVESADFMFLMDQTGLTWGNMSSHLSKLEATGYVKVSKEFVGRKPRTILSITRKGREAYRTYRRDLESMLHSMPE